MKVTIIGSGNVATVLGKKMLHEGFVIHQVYSRNQANGAELAAALQATAVDSIDRIDAHAAIYIIALTDKALVELAPQLQFGDKLVLHTAGSVSMDVLKHASTQYGVLYPVQSIRKDMDVLTPVPFLIDGCTDAVTQQIEDLAWQLSDTVERGGDEQRMKLHVAAVFVCNFVNFLYLQSAGFCQKEQLPFALLQPLIEETALRLREFHPAEVFTGPAVRGDVQTIAKHMQLLEHYPQMQDIYQQLTADIVAFAQAAKQ